MLRRVKDVNLRSTKQQRENVTGQLVNIKEHSAAKEPDISWLDQNKAETRVNTGLDLSDGQTHEAKHVCFVSLGSCC